MSHSYTVHSTHYWSDQCATGGGVGDINQGEHVHREKVQQSAFKCYLQSKKHPLVKQKSATPYKNLVEGSTCLYIKKKKKRQCALTVLRLFYA